MANDDGLVVARRAKKSGGRPRQNPHATSFVTAPSQIPTHKQHLQGRQMAESVYNYMIRMSTNDH